MLELEKYQLKIGVILSYLSIGIGFSIYFFLTPFILSKVGKIEYGLYSLVLSIVNYLNLLEFGLNSAYIRYYLKFKTEGNKYKVKQLNGTFLFIFFTIGIIASLFCLLMSRKIHLIVKEDLSAEYIFKMKEMLYIISIMILFSFINIIFNCYLVANEKFIFQKGIQLLKIILDAIIIILFLIVGYGILGIIYTKTFLVILVFIINVIYSIKKIKMKFTFKFLELFYIKEMFSFSSLIFLQMLISEVLWNIDKVVLSKISGIEEVAVYSLAAQINTYYVIIGSTISNVFIPKVNKLIFSSSKTEAEKNKLLITLMGKIGRIQLLILSPILLTFILFGKKFIILWVGKNYIGTYYIATILIIVTSFLVLQSIGVEIERARNMQKFMCLIGILLAILNLIISIPMAKLYGGIGSAIGTVISVIIGHIFIRNWYYNKKMDLNIKVFFKEIFKLFPALFLTLIFGLLLLKVFLINTFFDLFFLMFVFNIIYIIIIWLIGMNRSEKELVLKPINNILCYFKI